MDPSSEKRKLFNKFSQRFKRLKQSNESSQVKTPENPAQSNPDDFQAVDKLVISSALSSHYTVEEESSRETDTESDNSESHDSQNIIQGDQYDNVTGQPSLYLNKSIEESEQCRSLPLNISLSNWALKHNINHTALSDLLIILKQEHPTLPKDARTFLKTPRHAGSQIRCVAPGSYYHFGLAQCLQNILAQLLKENRFIPSVLEICVNIDGLPISQSSSNQVWPIMIEGLVTEEISRFELRQSEDIRGDL
ncbi:hypothetical protein PPYR_00070 [Photinus pyralis]|uniref:Uncharacterized protein n=1 Tax=Photinus pyralis TaxID=7054 RepID=A0A5N4B116_PHOPY|nr:hypothetical protein PPYR_00070 [Photinus pyralis]